MNPQASFNYRFVCPKCRRNARLELIERGIVRRSSVGKLVCSHGGYSVGGCEVLGYEDDRTSDGSRMLVCSECGSEFWFTQVAALVVSGNIELKSNDV